MAAAVLLAVWPGAGRAEDPAPFEPRFIANESLKLGIDLTSGGGVFWLSRLPDGPNLINHFDRGRLIQQSYYGDEDGSLWVERPWCWNPVQGGDYRGLAAAAELVEAGEDWLRVRGIPRHWATGESLDECEMEQWIHLDGDQVRLRYRFTYRGEMIHAPRHQEMPALFVDAALDTLVFVGEEGLVRTVPGWPNEYHSLSEPWAAFIGPDETGLGIRFPGTREITTYRHPGDTGPRGGGCSYLSPIRTFGIAPGHVTAYQVHLVIGTLSHIREILGGPENEREPAAEEEQGVRKLSQ